MTYLIDFNGFKNHINDASGRLKKNNYEDIGSVSASQNLQKAYLGFSNGSGSFRPQPAGFRSASSFVSR